MLSVAKRMPTETPASPPARFDNMDMVRYILCLMVFLCHYFRYNGIATHLPVNTFNVGFFALSGFLAYRTFSKAPSSGQYIRRRFFRLMTPYFLTVTAFAILLVFASSLPASEYFTSSEFWKYLACNLSTLNFLSPELPGVFTGDNFTIHVVNGTLWTMKVELMLFMTFPVYMYFDRKYPRQRNRILALIIIISLIYRMVMSMLYTDTGNRIYDILGRQFFGEFAFYYLGVATYLNFGRFIKFKWHLFTAILLLALIKYSLWDFPASSPLLISSAAIWLSAAGSYGKIFSRKGRGNITYMIYLCHAPIIQTGILLGLRTLTPGWLQLCITVSVTLIISHAIMRLSDSIIHNPRFDRIYNYC